VQRTRHRFHDHAGGDADDAPLLRRSDGANREPVSYKEPTGASTGRRIKAVRTPTVQFSRSRRRDADDAPSFRGERRGKSASPSRARNRRELLRDDASRWRERLRYGLQDHAGGDADEAPLLRGERRVISVCRRRARYRREPLRDDESRWREYLRYSLQDYDGGTLTTLTPSRRATGKSASRPRARYRREPLRHSPFGRAPCRRVIFRLTPGRGLRRRWRGSPRRADLFRARPS